MDDNGLFGTFGFLTKDRKNFLTIGDNIDEKTWAVILTKDSDFYSTRWNLNYDERYPTAIQYTKSSDAFEAGPYLCVSSNTIVKNGYKLHYSELSYGKIEDQLKFNIKSIDTDRDYVNIYEDKNSNYTLFYLENDKSAYFAEINSSETPEGAKFLMPAYA
ncbi:hypothetical protein [Brucella haematophila]|uniref:hypothetical protein n=1 Tax=Brucella haematophila TaxID=419474 RepID=UPI00110DAFD2|nr:hypothetical protein [Brucella haematophila]TMU96075.1 hypothetical protein FGI60_18670 [Brucella haematophila]